MESFQQSSISSGSIGIVVIMMKVVFVAIHRITTVSVILLDIGVIAVVGGCHCEMILRPE